MRNGHLQANRRPRLRLRRYRWRWRPGRNHDANRGSTSAVAKRPEVESQLDSPEADRVALEPRRDRSLDQGASGEPNFDAPSDADAELPFAIGITSNDRSGKRGSRSVGGSDLAWGRRAAGRAGAAVECGHASYSGTIGNLPGPTLSSTLFLFFGGKVDDKVEKASSVNLGFGGYDEAFPFGAGMNVDRKSCVFEFLGDLGQEESQVVHDKGRLEESVADFHGYIKASSPDRGRREKRRRIGGIEHKTAARSECLVNQAQKRALLSG